MEWNAELHAIGVQLHKPSSLKSWMASEQRILGGGEVRKEAPWLEFPGTRTARIMLYKREVILSNLFIFVFWKVNDNTKFKYFIIIIILDTSYASIKWQIPASHVCVCPKLTDYIPIPQTNLPHTKQPQLTVLYYIVFLCSVTGSKEDWADVLRTSRSCYYIKQQSIVVTWNYNY